MTSGEGGGARVVSGMRTNEPTSPTWAPEASEGQTHAEKNFSFVAGEGSGLTAFLPREQGNWKSSEPASLQRK